MLNRSVLLLGLAIAQALAAAISNRASATPYQDAVLVDNPAYYWTFDEEGMVNAIEQVHGQAADEFVPGANAAKVDSTTTAGGVSLGRAAQIIGTGGYTWNVADLSGSGMTGAWAYEFWANADDVTTYEYVIGSNAANGFNSETILKWGPGSPNPAGIQLYNGGGVIGAPSDAPAVTPGWHHYVFVSDGAADAYDIYVDGAHWGSATNGTHSHGPHPEVALKLGGWTDGASPEVFDGLLDELAIYDLSGADDLSAAGQRIAGHYFVSVEELRIRQFSHDGGTGMLTLEWESQAGRLYNLRSEADLSAGDPITWPIFGGNQDLEATPPENSVTIPLPADAHRFFVIEEFPAPPVAVFSDNFEGGEGNWTRGGAPGSDPFTNWEIGSPTTVGPTSANSPPNCFGTNLSANYANDADLWLRSPAIDLTAAAGATLSFSHYVDVEEGFDFGQVRLLDADAALAELAILEMTIAGNSPADWGPFSKALPAAAVGKNVVIEFRFSSDEVSAPAQAGWYIDDVLVSIPAP